MNFWSKVFSLLDLEMNANVSSRRRKTYCCVNRWERDWFMGETFIRCFGIRTGMFVWSVLNIVDGLCNIIAGGWFLLYPNTTVWFIDASLSISICKLVLGVLSLIFGIIGLYGVWRICSKWMKIFYYYCIGVLFLLIPFMIWTVVHYWTENKILSIVVMSGSPFVIIIWIYFIYKTKRFCDLTVLHENGIDQHIHIDHLMVINDNPEDSKNVL